MSLKPTVLLYNFTDKRRKNQVNTFCAMHGIRMRTVEKEQYERPVLTLVDKEAEALFAAAGEESAADVRKEKTDGEPADFAEEMLVMCQIGGQMNALLSYLRREKVIVPLKAVLTPVNQFWSSVELYQEIRKEHEQMKGLEA